MNLSPNGIRGKVYINDSLCKYHKFLWKNLKACSQTNLLTTFGLLMVPWRLKAVENVRVHVITHLTDLKELFPENQLLSEDQLLRFCLYFLFYFAFKSFQLLEAIFILFYFFYFYSNDSIFFNRAQRLIWSPVERLQWRGNFC